MDRTVQGITKSNCCIPWFKQITSGLTTPVAESRSSKQRLLILRQSEYLQLWRGFFAGITLPEGSVEGEEASEQ